MRYRSIEAFLNAQGAVLKRGPIAIIMAEDGIELEASIRHHQGCGFAQVILFAAPELPLDPALEETIHRIDGDVFAGDALVQAVNGLIDAAAGQWLYYCYNAEFLFFPFCETRNIRDLVTFHSEERRQAMLTYVVDLYAGDFDKYDDAVTLEEAYLDRSGYYALGRKDPENNWAPKERQLDFFGGLRWRFEEHVPWTRRKIDRISIFRAEVGLRLNADFCLSVEELNTYSCPWHNNITAAVCSFRTAKALRSNPGSRYDIATMLWHNSVPFAWNSQQLMDLGLMEPGQWF